MDRNGLRGTRWAKERVRDLLFSDRAIPVPVESLDGGGGGG